MKLHRTARHAWTLGAVALLGWQTPLHAAVITYDYKGVMFGRVGCTGGACPPGSSLVDLSGNTFSASLTVDTTSASITSFTYQLGTLGSWTGSGGTISKSTSNLSFDLTTAAGSTYTSTGQNGAALSFFSLLRLQDPASAFHDFVDGYATSFDVGAITLRGGGFIFNGPQWFGSGSNRLDTVTATVQQTGTAVSEPGTVALAGAAGLAALGAMRRRKGKMAA